MTTNNFYYIASLLEQLYGITIQEEDLEEIGLLAWGLIGNKRTRLYKLTICLDKCQDSVELPCNCDILEAVTADFEDFEHVSNIYDKDLPGSFTTESYIESEKRFKNPLYMSGKYIPYERVGNVLYLHQPYNKINILYKGILLDEEGLPEINDKEALAIATYIAYTYKFKEALLKGNPNSMKAAEFLKSEWLKMCDRARVPEEINQNEMDEILDAKNSWNRKILLKSYKPLR